MGSTGATATTGATGAGLPERVDVVVVGGGAGGLSLAARLSRSRWRDRDVLVLDDGSRGPLGRSWAFWSRTPGLLDDAVCATFDRVAVRGERGGHVVDLGPYRYRVVRGEDLSRLVDDMLAATPGVRRHPGHVEAVIDGPHEAEVLVDGRPVRARWVFDSVGLRPGRPPAPVPRRTPGRTGPVDSLDFSGRRVETAVDVFDPAVPVLMDFRTTQDDGLGFVYVLPTSARSALVEHTRFSRGEHRPSEADEDLRTYLEQVLALGPHRVVGVERGRIALGTSGPPAPGRRVVPIGGPAGMVRASTGYGYARMQRHSADLVDSLVRHGHPFDVAGRPRRHRSLDRILLRAIGQDPGRVVDAFERLFTRNPGERVLRFLDEDTSPRQELALVLSLPPAPFLRAVLPSRRWRNKVP